MAAAEVELKFQFAPGLSKMRAAFDYARIASPFEKGARGESVEKVMTK